MIYTADAVCPKILQRLAEQRVTLTVTAAARAHVARAGYDAVYGARPLKRYIQQHIETPIARKLIAGTVAAGGTLTVDANKDGLTIAP